MGRLAGRGRQASMLALPFWGQKTRAAPRHLPPTAKTKPVRVSCGWKPKPADVFLFQFPVKEKAGAV